MYFSIIQDGFQLKSSLSVMFAKNEFQTVIITQILRQNTKTININAII